LVDKIESVKTKAEVSEEMVKSICSEIRSLDFAKRNITFTITSLKRIIMLGRIDQDKSLMKCSDWNRTVERVLHQQVVQGGGKLDRGNK
jgi:hypothetical protein